jgi:hypothetical protein
VASPLRMRGCAARQRDPAALMQQLIGAISHSVPTALREVITLGRTLKRRAVDVLAISTAPAPPTDRPRQSTTALNTSATEPSASATSPTTSPDRFWRPAGSGPGYTLDHEEPDKGDMRPPAGGPAGSRRTPSRQWVFQNSGCWQRPAASSGRKSCLIMNRTVLIPLKAARAWSWSSGNAVFWLAGRRYGSALAGAVLALSPLGRYFHAARPGRGLLPQGSPPSWSW